MEDEKYFGKDCPQGMVQIEFVGVDPTLRYSNYGWKPCKRAILEVYVDGKRFRIEVGDCESATPQGKRRGLHIVTEGTVRIDHHSVNALDIWLDSAQEGSHHA